MRLAGTQKAALIIAVLLLIISGTQLDITVAALRCWRHVHRAAASEFVVPQWWTPYTIGSAVFAPLWLAVTGAVLILVRRFPKLALVSLSAFLIAAPMSCGYAPSLDPRSGGFLGLEELPFTSAEREANRDHLMRVNQRLKSRAQFPLSPQELRDVVGSLASETSPYEQGGVPLNFALSFQINRGVPFSTEPAKPGIVYYAVNSDGSQFALTISGLNAPAGDRPKMMRETTFVGSKQPWGGLLVLEEVNRSGMTR
jgi:hypothetical protein